MNIFIHRVNTIQKLQTIPEYYGIEIDIRANGNDLILNHDPFVGGERFEDFLSHYKHSGIVLNIKEAGIESRVLGLMKSYGVTNYFLLDVEFPYIYREARNGVRDIAMRYSEDEGLDTVLKYEGLVDRVWIDTNTKLPLNTEIINKLKGFKTCLVCPERRGRPQDIQLYIDAMKQLHFVPDGVMTALQYAPAWESYGNFTV